MSDYPHIGLDNPAFRDRLRPSVYQNQQQAWSVPPSAPAETETFPELVLEPIIEPVDQEQTPATGLKGQLERRFGDSWAKLVSSLRPYSRLQLTLVGIASLVFLLGLTISLQTRQANNNAAAELSALSKQLVQITTGNNKIISTPHGTPLTIKPAGQ